MDNKILYHFYVSFTYEKQIIIILCEGYQEITHKVPPFHLILIFPLILKNIGKNSNNPWGKRKKLTEIPLLVSNLCESSQLTLPYLLTT